MGVDPRDPAAVGAALVAVATERFGGPVTLADPAVAIGAGLDSHIVAATLTGPSLPSAWRVPLVVRLLPEVGRMPQAEAEAAVQRWCAERGYPVPAVLAVLEPAAGFDLPAQIMERIDGVTVLDAIRARPWRLGSLLGAMAELQLRLHALPVDGWPTSSDPMALVDKRLGLPRRVAAERGPGPLADALDAVAALAPVAAGGEAVVCHGDLHPLNVLVSGAQQSVIDWTDAGLGPREADVSRTLLLFHVAALAATGRIERAVLGRAGPAMARRYERAYARNVTLDPERMLAWEALHAVHGWAQVELLHAGGFDGASSADPARVSVALADHLRGRVQQVLADLT